MSNVLRKAAGFVIYRENCNGIIEYLLMQASYGEFHWTPPKGKIKIILRIIQYYSILLVYINSRSLRDK